LSSTTKKKFKLRYEEGYDVKDDEVYNVWSKLNELNLDGGEETQDLEPTSKCQQCATADSSQKVGEVFIFKQNLVILDKVPHKTMLRALQKLPEHLSGDEAIANMENNDNRSKSKKRKNEKKKETSKAERKGH